MEDLTLVVYTHSDYSDLWVPCYERIKRFSKIEKKVVITDKLIEGHFEGYQPIFYDDSLRYNKRLESTLSKIETKYILFLHEDMFLYGEVNHDMINYDLKFMIDNPEYKFTRLIKSGINSNQKLSENLFSVNNNDVKFSITPTIWDKEALIDVSSKLAPLSIWEFEQLGDSYFKHYNINGLYNFNGESKRGLNHYDSNVFPHMCSAIFKGKWNMEYRGELDDLFNEFNIDVNLRGTIF